MRPLLLLLLTLNSVCLHKAMAAACCGGGVALPALIAGDDAAQVSLSQAYTWVSVDSVDSSGYWHEGSVHQKVLTTKLDGAFVFADRWQAGLSIPFVRRALVNKNYFGVGDITGNLAYEWLPDWDYNPYRPKGLAFLQLTLPTGKSKVTSLAGGLDSRGTGYWSVGFGFLLSKAWGDVDVFAPLEIHHGFVKREQVAGETIYLNPSWGGSAGLGAGYSWRNFRAGVALIYFYEGPMALEGKINSSGNLERYATASTSLSYIPNDGWSGTFTYSDQTLFGEPLNTSLGKSVSLQLVRRWGR